MQRTIQSTSPESTFAQQNEFDIYTDVAAYMTWISGTIKKMGGMLACDLVIEETNPEGDYFCYVICICYDEYSNI